MQSPFPEQSFGHRLAILAGVFPGCFSTNTRHGVRITSSVTLAQAVSPVIYKLSKIYSNKVTFLNDSQCWFMNILTKISALQSATILSTSMLIPGRSLQF